MPQNEFLIRRRKDLGLHQKDLGKRLGIEKEGYAQRKVSLWESLQAKPSDAELEILATVLNCDKVALTESFSGQALPMDPASLIQPLRSSSPALIATCAGSQTRSKLLEEVQDQLVPALDGNVSLAIFFPYPLKVAGTGDSTAIVGVAGLYVQAWTTLLNFYVGLKSRLSEEAAAERIALYRPKATVNQPANILVPPMLRRSTLTFHRVGKDLRRSLYVWTQSDQRDRFYEMEVTSPDILDQQNLENQLNAWEWYFGDIVSHWKTGSTLISQDAYWSKFSDKE